MNHLPITLTPLVVLNLLAGRNQELGDGILERNTSPTASDILAGGFGDSIMSKFYWNTITENMRAVLMGLLQRRFTIGPINERSRTKLSMRVFCSRLHVHYYSQVVTE